MPTFTILPVVPIIHEQRRVHREVSVAAKEVQTMIAGRDEELWRFRMADVMQSFVLPIHAVSLGVEDVVIRQYSVAGK